MIENKEAELRTDMEKDLRKILPNLLEYAKSDETLSQIKNIFSVHLGRRVDQHNISDIVESLKKIIDQDTIDFLVNLIANDDLDLIKFAEEIIKEKKLSDFLRELIVLYGTLAERARFLKYYPNEWINMHSAVIGDQYRGFMVKTEFSLGSGKKVRIIASPNGSILAAQHFIKNIIDFVDSTVEDKEGKELNLLHFVSHKDFKELQEQVEILKKKLEQKIS